MSDSLWSYTWDAENRLIAQEMSTSLPAAARQRLEFTYDWQGRRIRKLVKDSSLQVLSDTRFVYDGWNLVAELNSDLSLKASYAWGLDLSGSLQGAGGVGGLLFITVAGDSYFPAYDGNGNVMALCKGSDATWAAQYEYGPFGELIRATGPMAKTNPFRFSTKYQDEETGLVYYGYRYYSPSLGRWLSRDPLEEEDFLNLYLFCSNDPIFYVDLDGLDSSKGAMIGRPENIKTVFDLDEMAGAGSRIAPRIKPPRLPSSPRSPRPNTPRPSRPPEADPNRNPQPDLKQFPLPNPVKLPELPFVPPQPTNRKPCCRFIYHNDQRGGGSNSPHNQYARYIFGVGIEVTVTTPEGDSARYDGVRPIPDPIMVGEVKTGRRWSFQNPESDNPGSQQGMSECDPDQFEKQLRVAKKCQIECFIFFREQLGRDGYVKRYPEYAPYMEHIKWP